MLLLSTLDNISTPCSVKADGSFLLPPQLEVAFCDFKFLNSSSLNWKQLTCLILTLQYYASVHFPELDFIGADLSQLVKCFSVGHALISVPSSLRICKKL